ncbi:hypothetical protein FOH10_12360 [Nocardia otitidiscaviarum]|uniref:Uncharacterized protein n=2 Tax=Nocardia otitidiscaviarum TaxID=1823 RepID=A0A516NKF2_9NOCA|nr:hypothetical protein [Nocardia otitidiscaviarum]MCP9618597.1 hypothetical protein [Nocardia otitidiscaviarum]QDP79388.1 hypothetical protein FOH10_12360 [Nocardia otitidiscaviarum]
MDREAFVAVMNEASGMLDQGQAVEALERLTAFDDSLLDQPDPKDYGWIVSYRFRAAFAAADFAQALRIAESGPARFAADIPAGSMATMYSMAVEAATQLDRADVAVSMADKCIAIRRQLGAENEVLMAAMTACTLLGDIERHDLATPYAVLLVREGEGFDDYRSYGYYALCAAVEHQVGGDVFDILWAGRDWLTGVDNEFAREAREYLDSAPAIKDRIAGVHGTGEQLPADPPFPDGAAADAASGPDLLAPGKAPFAADPAAPDLDPLGLPTVSSGAADERPALPNRRAAEPLPPERDGGELTTPSGRHAETSPPLPESDADAALSLPDREVGSLPPLPGRHAGDLPPQPDRETGDLPPLPGRHTGDRPSLPDRETGGLPPLPGRHAGGPPPVLDREARIPSPPAERFAGDLPPTPEEDPGGLPPLPGRGGGLPSLPDREAGGLPPLSGRDSGGFSLVPDTDLAPEADRGGLPPPAGADGGGFPSGDTAEPDISGLPPLPGRRRSGRSPLDADSPIPDVGAPSGLPPLPTRGERADAPFADPASSNVIPPFGQLAGSAADVSFDEFAAPENAFGEPVPARPFSAALPPPTDPSTMLLDMNTAPAPQDAALPADGPKQPPADQCAGGETADALLAAGRAQLAASAFRALIDDALEAGQPDPLIMAKSVLGLLTALIFDDRVAEAHAVWTDNSGPTYLGIWALENGQTSVHDAVAYALIEAFLHSLGTGDPITSANAVDALMSRCLDFAFAQDPDAIGPMLNTWRRHIHEIFEGTPPPPALAAVQHAEQRWGHPVPPGPLYWMRPYRWVVDWL